MNFTKNLTNQWNIKIDQDKIERVSHARLHGVQVDEKLSWNNHVRPHFDYCSEVWDAFWILAFQLARGSFASLLHYKACSQV